MSCILNIETSTSVCSVALSMDGEVLFAKASFDGPSHAALLGVFVEEALSVLKKKGKKALDAVAVSSGPGSYTGLRIGVSVAKGLCFGFGIPLIGIHTLDIMAATVNSKGDSQIVSITDDCLYCAMLDARRMEVYAAIYDASLKPVRERPILWKPVRMLLIWKKGKFVSLATVFPNANRSSLLRTPSLSRTSILLP